MGFLLTSAPRRVQGCMWLNRVQDWPAGHGTLKTQQLPNRATCNRESSAAFIDYICVCHVAHNTRLSATKTAPAARREDRVKSNMLSPGPTVSAQLRKPTKSYSRSQTILKVVFLLITGLFQNNFVCVAYSFGVKSLNLDLDLDLDSSRIQLRHREVVRGAQNYMKIVCRITYTI